MASPKDYEEIDRPYDGNLQRPKPATGTDNGSVESKSVKSDGAIDNVWITNFIRSDKWKPKTYGFYIDGQTGYAEFTDVYISGEIDNGLLNISGNDIYLYDNTTGGGGQITGDAASLNFVRFTDHTKYFSMRKRAGRNYNLDNVLEIFASQPAEGRNNFIFIGRTGDLLSSGKNVSVVSLDANIVTGDTYLAGTGQIQMTISTDGTTLSAPHFSVFDSRAYSSAYSGVSANLIGSGTNTLVGMGTIEAGIVFYYNKGVAGGGLPVTGELYTAAHILPEIDNTFDLGSPTFRFRNIYATNVGAGHGMQVFTASGTFTVPDGVTEVFVEAVGGGAGGGSTNNSGGSTGEVGKSGGSGGYCRKVIDLTGVATVTVTIGAGGAGGTSGVTEDGDDGGDTTFGAHLTAGGGFGSGTGGSATGGDLNVQGQAGGVSWNPAVIGSSTNVHAFSGDGGSSFFGNGARGKYATSGSALDGGGGQNYGSGGSGGASASGGADAAGGNGAGGLLIVYW